MNEKQLQKAGDYSQQIQADSITIINGIDEKRAREIFGEMYNIARNDLTKEAYSIATQRVNEFENDLIPRMKKIEGSMDAFADPGFQFLLKSAHKTAASTERKGDYSLLSELLIYRIQNGSCRNIRAGISRAVEIVDEISDDALLGLTAAFTILNYCPTSPNVFKGLDVLNDIYKNICYSSLPINTEWIEHLDILDAVRMSSFGKMVSLENLYSQKMPGYCENGIKKDSENYKKAIDMLNESSLPISILVVNELNTEYVKLHLLNEAAIDNLGIVQKNNGNNKEVVKELTNEQKQVVHSIYKMYDSDNTVKQEIMNKFIDELNTRPYIAIIRDWWNSLPISFSITSVGRVLAHSNARRCDETLPDMYIDQNN